MISSAEWEVMRVIWTKTSVSSSDIKNILCQKLGWSSSTIKTLLGRLKKKGFLGTERVGNKFIYTALLSENDAIEVNFKQLLGKICQTKHIDLLEYMLKELPMTKEHIHGLEEILSKKYFQAVKEVPCHCYRGQCSCQECEEH